MPVGVAGHAARTARQIVVYCSYNSESTPRSPLERLIAVCRGSDASVSVTCVYGGRFAVPAGTFGAVVNVSKCEEAGGGGGCPLTLAASPLALPDTEDGPFTK